MVSIRLGTNAKKARWQSRRALENPLMRGLVVVDGNAIVAGVDACSLTGADIQGSADREVDAARSAEIAARDARSNASDAHRVGAAVAKAGGSGCRDGDGLVGRARRMQRTRHRRTGAGQAR